MRVFLLYRDRDFDPGSKLPPNAEDLVQDLGLDILIKAMAQDDSLVSQVARSCLLQSLTESDDIFYRQAMLKDCLSHEDVVRQLYALAVQAIEARRKNWFSSWGAHSRPSSIQYSAVNTIKLFVPMLEGVRRLAAENAARFTSEGFKRFFAVVQAELSDEYFNTLRAHLDYLSLGQGILIGAHLGKGCESVELSIRKPKDFGKGWLRRILRPRTAAFSFSLDPRDEAGGRALEEFKDRGVNFSADALARSADHIESFFKVMMTELAFYIGCLNLRATLAEVGEPFCFPTPTPAGALRNEASGLYYIGLSLHARKPSIGNDLRARGSNPIIITGVNEGGKSTFLRSLGVAQLMMQCGMFVPAKVFVADIAHGVFTHFRRKEDRSMTSGKFDEELVRMETIAGQLAPHSLILFNESFAATNEREGSEIARQILQALIEDNIRVVFVTHLYTLAKGFSESPRYRTLFLRAERQDDGTRSFKLSEGEPSPKSHGEDLYRAVFG